MPKVNTKETQAAKEAKLAAKRFKRLNKKLQKGQKYRAKRLTPENLKTIQDNAVETQRLLQEQLEIQIELNRLNRERNAFLDKIDKAIDDADMKSHQIDLKLRALNPGCCHGCGLLGGHFGKKADTGCCNGVDGADSSDPDVEPTFSEAGNVSVVLRWGKTYTDEQLKAMVLRYEIDSE